MIVKQFVKKKNEKELSFTDPLDSDNSNTIEGLSDIDKIEKDSEYSEHVEKSENIEELDDTDEPENITKTSEIDEKMEGIEDSIENDEAESKENPKKEEK
jgi:signal peptidase